MHIMLAALWDGELVTYVVVQVIVSDWYRTVY